MTIYRWLCTRQDVRNCTSGRCHPVLRDKHKRLIRALVLQHAANAALFDDTVADKGQGLVDLLCGNPGWSKFLTVEAAAEITHCLLSNVSKSELGTSHDRVDDKLIEILELA
jgi:hypothetical protein